MEKVKAVVHAKALKQYIALRILLIFLHNLQFHLFFFKSDNTHTAAWKCLLASGDES